MNQTGQGRVLRAFGEEVTILLDGSQTGGQFCLLTETTPPGGGPTPHWRDNVDELFYVLAGRMPLCLPGALTRLTVPVPPAISGGPLRHGPVAGQ